jgi:hypothetical protein
MIFILKFPLCFIFGNYAFKLTYPAANHKNIKLEIIGLKWHYVFMFYSLVYQTLSALWHYSQQLLALIVFPW